MESRYQNQERQAARRWAKQCVCLDETAATLYAWQNGGLEEILIFRQDFVMNL
jgi:hypothetical protein